MLRNTLLFSTGLGLVLALCRAPAFISKPAPMGRTPGFAKQSSHVTPKTFRRAEEGSKDDDGDGMLKFLKEEQDINLSPEEYQLALDQEIESQRKRYYIDGNVKAGNEVVPWKKIDEDQLLRDAKRRLKRNGIIDPSSAKDEEKDSEVSCQLLGGEDVQLDWIGGAPGKKVGYIIERKKSDQPNFYEIATYENELTQYLLIKPFAGQAYNYNDQSVKPGDYTYRVLIRYRSGEVEIVDQKDITVPPPPGFDFFTSLAALVGVLGFVIAYGFLVDPQIKE